MGKCLKAELPKAAFYVAAHRVIYGRMRAVYQERGEVAIEVLAEELRRHEELEDAGGFDTLLKISGRQPTTAQTDYFLDTVRGYWVRRELIKRGTALVEGCYEKVEDLPAFVGAETLQFTRIADYVAQVGREDVREVAARGKQLVAQAVAGQRDRSKEITTGWDHVDEVFFPIDPLMEHWLTYLAGPPSGGKSTVARNLIGNNLRAGKRVVLFLLETSRLMWMRLLAATWAGLDPKFYEDWERPAKYKAWCDYHDEIESWLDDRLFIYDDVFDLVDIERITRETQRKVAQDNEGEELALAMVDHLGLVTMQKKKFRGTAEERTTEMSRTFKLLFKALNLAGLVLVQLNRSSRLENRRPTMSDLRGSGSLEQDADVILLVFTPKENRAGQEQAGMDEVETQLIQAKKRNGVKDVAVQMICKPALGQYRDAEPSVPGPGAPKPSGGYKRE
jgi:replicative DNA helicase